MWQVDFPDDGPTHVHPINDLRPHVTDGRKCWCNPFDDEGVIVHNALDGRTYYELDADGRRKLN